MAKCKQNQQAQSWQEYYEGIFSEILSKEYTEKQDPRVVNKTYQTPKLMAEKAIEYFVMCGETGKQITFESLRVYMHFWSKEAFYKYKNNQIQYKEDFATVVQIICSIIEGVYVETLFTPAIHGARFVLQCNYGWIPAERQIIEKHDISVTIGKPTPAKDED